MSATLTPLELTFKAFTLGKPQMDGRTWAKVLKESKLLDKAMTQTDGDLIFAKAKVRGSTKITFADFQKALVLVAEKKKITEEQVSDTIVAAEGPHYIGTKAEANRFHDDKNLYTGTLEPE
eukprot:GHVU01040475.1.p2 GENE.GHVU01040475.1~~GHVU01040475.1.p2  ORF type:complete len:121 (+),score=19.90 GHVU01040475.1:84-446(+)